MNACGVPLPHHGECGFKAEDAISEGKVNLQ